MRLIVLGLVILHPTAGSAAPAAPRVGGGLHSAGKQDVVKLSGLDGEVGLPVSETHAATRGGFTKQRAGHGRLHEWQHRCPQPGPLFPESSDGLSQMERFLASGDFLEASAKRVSGAVRINTTSTDGMQSLPGDDPAWDHMRPLSGFLEESFPLVHENLNLERVNTHGLLYTWQGSNESSKPAVLMAHQDVVPVEPESEKDWKYAPFSGHWDGKHVWGRGAVDCKSTLIASLEAVEELLRAGFSPLRTVILSFGFDEEISGNQGARHLSQRLARRYSENGVAVVIDEGSGIARSWWGSVAAFPAVAEKGYFDAEITVDMRAGHSSLPPEDNSITVMAEIIQELNASKHHATTLAESNPIMETLFCAAQHDRAMPDAEREAVASIDRGGGSVQELVDRMVSSHPSMGGFFRTTQSIGMVHGGRKVNVVPGHTSLRINHRVSPLPYPCHDNFSAPCDGLTSFTGHSRQYHKRRKGPSGKNREGIRERSLSQQDAFDC